MAELTAEEQATLNSLTEKAGVKVGGGITRDELAPLFYTLAEQMKGFQQQLDTHNARVASNDVEQQEEPKEVDSAELDTMSRAEYTAWVLNKVKESQTKPLAAEVATTRQEQRKADLTRQAEAANAAHPDFQSYMPEMREILKANPSLNIERAYGLAKIENPEKAQKIDAENKLKEEVAVSKDNVLEVAFGGLTPTSSITTTRGAEPITDEEAREKAWEESDMDDVLAALDGT